MPDYKQQIANKSCAFCLEAQSGYLEDAMLDMLGAPKIKRVIAENEDFFVVPSLGPLTWGHLLVVSAVHYDCLRDAPHEFTHRAISTALGIRNLLQKALNTKVMIFENGEKADNDDGTCIAHVHLHLVPLPPGVEVANIATDNNFTRVMDTASTRLVSLPKSQDYSIIIEGSKEIYILQGDAIPSQHMRSILAKKIGVSGRWNWRDFPAVDEIIKMTKEFSSYQFLPDLG